MQLTQRLHGHALLQENDFWPAFLAVGVLSMLSIPFTARLPANAGQEMAGRTKSVAISSQAAVETAVEGAP